MDEHGDGWVSVAEAVELTGKTARSLRRWVTMGKLQAQHTADGRTRYRLADLAALSGPVRTQPDSESTHESAPPLIAEVITVDEQAQTHEQGQAFTLGRRIGELETEARLARQEADRLAEQLESLRSQLREAELAREREAATREAVEAERDRLAALMSASARTHPDSESGHESTSTERPPRPWWRRWFTRAQ